MINSDIPHEVESIIKRHYSKISNLVFEAWEAWLEGKGGSSRKIPGTVFDNRSIGSTMNCLLKQVFTLNEKNYPNLRCIEKKGLFCVIVEGKILIRFNLMNKNGHTMHTQTDQSISYRDGDSSLFPDIKPIKNLYAGFVLDVTSTRIVNLLLLERDGNGNPIWKYDMSGMIERQLSFFPEVEESKAIKPSRIRAKKSKKDDKTGTDNS